MRTRDDAIGHALSLDDEAEQDVRGTDVAVLQPARLVLPEHDELPSRSVNRSNTAAP